MNQQQDTWRALISKALAERDETFADVVHSTLTADQLDARFDAGFGGSEGDPFTLWTAKHVYFPCVYDGAEWVESVPRDPCDEATAHVGGQ